MPFPERSRVFYDKNPLDNVICQLRFPPILKIDAEVPSAFQDSIRSDYPLYSEQAAPRITLNLGQNPQNIINRFTTSSVIKNHEFCSADNSYKINLTRTFLSISTPKYTNWEDFIQKIRVAFEALVKNYNPPFFTRIGLRYIDIIDRSKLDLIGIDWCELLEPYFLGLLATDIRNNIKNFNNSYEIGLGDNDSVLILQTSFVQNAQSGEKCIVLDNDFNTPKRIALDKVFDKLTFLHSRATRLIQWIITDKLHEAMGPTDEKQ